MLFFGNFKLKGGSVAMNIYSCRLWLNTTVIFLFLIVSLLAPRLSEASAIKVDDPLGVIGFKWGDSIEVVKGKAKKNNLSYVREGVVEGDAVFSLDYRGKVFGIDEVKISTAFDNKNKLLTQKYWNGQNHRYCSWNG
jgi:hypothetical protein